jgi:SNF2 family DNA or RNA helicase
MGYILIIEIINIFLFFLRLGKTVTTIAFLQLRMNSIKPESSEQIFDSPKPKAIPTTLVICPATLMSHWENEITKYSRMRCFIYHGSSRKKDIPTGGAIRAFGQYCVVLTSYELVRAEHTSDEINPLFAVKWQRIVLDEGHRIRSHKSQTAQACSSLNAIYRWVLTGTPIHNKADDFYSLLHFLHYSPFDIYSTWKLFSSNQYKSIERMKTIVRSLILRRTKTDYDLNGKLLVPLPSKQIENLWLTLTDEEMKHYQRIKIEMTDAYKLFIRNRREKKKTNTVVLFTLM